MKTNILDKKVVDKEIQDLKRFSKRVFGKSINSIASVSFDLNVIKR